MFLDKHCHDFEYSETQLVARVPSSLHPTMKYESGILSPSSPSSRENRRIQCATLLTYSLKMARGSPPWR